MDGFYTGKEASEILNVHQRTLMNWDKKGLIETKRTDNNFRLYNVKKYLESNGKKHKTGEIKEIQFDDIKNLNKKMDVCYVRVLNIDSTNELNKQAKKMENLYPDALIIKDIGSGLDMEREGLLKIIDLIINNKINKLILSKKEELCRVGFEMINFMIKKYSNGEIILLDSVDHKETKEEIMDDMYEMIKILSKKMKI